MVWGVGEIEFFFLFAGGVGNCDFLFAKLGMDVCKPFCWSFFQPLLSKRPSAGVGRRNCPTSWSCSLIHAVPEPDYLNHVGFHCSMLKNFEFPDPPNNQAIPPHKRMLIIISGAEICHLSINYYIE